MLPPSPREFKDIYVVFELMETDLHQVCLFQIWSSCAPAQKVMPLLLVVLLLHLCMLQRQR